LILQVRHKLQDCEICDHAILIYLLMGSTSFKESWLVTPQAITTGWQPVTSKPTLVTHRLCVRFLEIDLLL